MFLIYLLLSVAYKYYTKENTMLDFEKLILGVHEHAKSSSGGPRPQKVWKPLV